MGGIKFLFVLLAIGFLLPVGVMCQSNIAKANTITKAFEDVPLGKALKVLKREFELSLAYDNRTVKSFRVNATFIEASEEEVMDALTEPFGLTYQLVNRTYVIFTKEITNHLGSGEDPMRINFKFHGRILDGKSLDPLPFASVSEVFEMTGTLTNEEGYFTLNNVSSDTTSVRVNYLGYKSLELKLIPSQIEDLNVIYLFPDKGILPVATIQAKQNASIETTSSPGVYAIDMNTISQLGNTGERDVIRALQLLPAVSGTTENSSEVHVRGGASDENLFLFDGFTIYHTDHFFGIFSAFNADAVKHVQLRKGTLQPRFGGRTSSVIEINGKNGNLLKPITKVNLSLMSASVLVESPIVVEKSSVLLAFRRSYSDVVFSPLYQSMFNNLYNRSLSSPSNNEVDAFSSNAPQFYFYDANVKFSFKASNKDQLHFSLYTGRDQLNIGYEDLTTDDRLSVQYNDESRWGNIGVSGKWNRQWNPDQATQAVLGFSSFNSDLFGFDVRKNLFIGITDSIFFDQNNVLQDLTLKLDHQVQVENHQLGFGLNFTNYFIDSQSFNRDGSENQTLSDEELTAIYMQDEVEFNDHWSLMAGLRWSLFSGTKTSYMEPRALLVYSPCEAFQMHAGGSRSNQFIRRIRRQNLFLNTPDSWALSSLEGVPVLQAEQISAGVRFNFKQFNVEVNAYYVEKDGTLQDVQALDGIPNGTYQNDLILGSGLSQGVEVLLKKDLGIHSGWLSYTLSQTENSFLDGPFNDLPADFDQLHELSVVYLFRYKRWKSSLAWVYGSGKPFTKALGTYDFNTLNGSSNEWVSFGETYGSRLPEYHRLDLSCTYSTTWVGLNVEIGTSLYNIYNRANPRELQYFIAGVEESGVSLDVKELSYLGFTPSLNLSFSW